MADDTHLLGDLRLEPRDALLPPVFRVADSQADVAGPGVPIPKRMEFETVRGTGNLAQAVTMRLLTRRGELAALGHPAYGSRLDDLLGRANTATTRGLVRLAVLEALAQERRIAEVVAVDVAAVPGAAHRIAVEAVVLPLPPGEAVRIGPITLELRP